ncbi:HNH endonuclease [Paenibacillus sp. GCM10012307]|uniref:HNH endonuclease n=1 Tax=Paenibacillus roseus TaxID=2798579 RepID=A0A934J4J7_9BACL|nr:HNH endonuclease [Paenibacillus roseus]MBJ6360696.1 HNH endonuclease [Paenibacillus roseus]
MAKSDEQARETCELCGRNGVQTTVHHLTPREKGGSVLPTAKLCSACHRQIHALYTNDDLITLELTSLPALRRDPSVARFLKWVRKQPPQFRPKLSKSHRVQKDR